VVTLHPTHLHWVKGDADDPSDLCAHSPVEFRLDGETLVRPENGDWTVSASALYLLRTLTADHTKERPVGDHLFPCCGFNMYEVEGTDDVLIFGCPGGIDFEVIHDGDNVVLREADGRMRRVALAEWRCAVCAFSDTVRAFYEASLPKQPHDEDGANGFRKFMAEWDRRRKAEDGRRSLGG
jgi:hypothetical protein